MKFYKVSKTQRGKVPKPNEYPVWKSGSEHNAEYFLKNIGTEVWEEPAPFDYNSEEADNKK